MTRFRRYKYLLILLFGVGTSLRGQVINDDCSSATQWGSLPSSFAGSCFDGTVQYDTTVMGSSAGAVVNLPYPTVPLNCFGYSPTVVAPANDAWWYFELIPPYGVDALKVMAGSDTLHLSVWEGLSCANLTPIGCLTVAPNQIQVLPTAYAFPGGRLYFQASGNVIGQATDFFVCLHSSVFAISYQSGDSTPVTCFGYEMSSQDCSAPGSSDGQAMVTITVSNTPIHYQWSNGDTSAMTSNLGPGTYTVTITDGTGCFELDSVNILEPALGIGSSNPSGIRVLSQPGAGGLTVEVGTGWEGADLVLYDLLGHEVAQWGGIPKGQLRVAVPIVSTGVLYWRAMKPGQEVVVGKVWMWL